MARVLDHIAENLEDKGLWRRAARRWLDAMDEHRSEELREEFRKRRNHCIKMIKDAGAISAK